MSQHLLGKGTWETEDAIKEQLKRQSSVYSIGPAGENLVRFAAIVGDHGHVAGHNGVGAVMGSKKLKAIAVERGRKEVPIADPNRLSEAANALIEDAMKKNPNMGKWGTAFGYPILAALASCRSRITRQISFPILRSSAGNSFVLTSRSKKLLAGRVGWLTAGR